MRDIFMPKFIVPVPIPVELTCPLSLDLFIKPVFIKDGRHYEKRYIKKWLKEHNTSPITGLILEDKSIVDSWDKKSDVEKFLGIYGICTNKQFLDAVKAGIVLLKYISTYLEAEDENGRFLHWAAHEGHPGMVDQLFADGANCKS